MRDNDATAVGQPVRTLDTPALVIDLDAMDGNIRRIGDECNARRIDWRPHVKSHASPGIAQRLLEAGAIGVTCAKLGEAEIMADAGVRRILIANQIVGAAKIARLVALARRADVVVVVDSDENLEAIASAGRTQRVRLQVAVEVDIGMMRSGVAPGEAAVALARRASALDGVRFVGFEAWEGHTAGIDDGARKRDAIVTAVGLLTSTADQCRSQGIAVEMVSCGGTATFPTTARIAGITELQAGGGIFGDLRCREEFNVDFAPALTLVSTVVSRPSPSRVVCDVGNKSLNPHPIAPRPVNLSGVTSVRLSAEHATLQLDHGSGRPAVGDRVWFLVGYSDNTILLHDQLYGVRAGVVEVVWDVGARSKAR